MCVLSILPVKDYYVMSVVKSTNKQSKNVKVTKISSKIIRNPRTFAIHVWCCRELSKDA